MSNDGPIITYDDPGGTVAEWREAMARQAEKIGVFALPRGARVEYLTPKPRRTLGAWRRKVAAPSALLNALWPSIDICTEDTRLSLCALVPATLRAAEAAAMSSP